ncbi:hypothetical protein COY62_03570 [bacterium (Candidatus Howlettbacteria) CG_4_10_14_0_8_um_filter_40_9]|nr:MAG: hypothetical protein COY62_03570 [bacterium (Candidatus Howlettbacteria) CG_4_10_14_0_8_um_filter_40_9]
MEGGEYRCKSVISPEGCKDVQGKEGIIFSSSLEGGKKRFIFVMDVSQSGIFPRVEGTGLIPEERGL